MRVLAICGSLRANSLNGSVLAAARLLAPATMAVVPLPAMGSLPHFNPDLDTPDRPHAVAVLRAEVDRADALLISSPEYAHGIPGTLKNLLDWLVGSETFAGKPVGLVNASPRAVHGPAQLAEVLTTMAAQLVPGACVTLPHMPPSSDARGIVADAGLAATLRAVLQALSDAASQRRPAT